ncbi:MAG: polymer-forming cytoskeletal protein [Crocinitomicaceae bacterium]
MGRLNNEKKTKSEGPDQLNRLVQGTELTGNITTSNSIRIDGIIKGNVNCGGKLVLGLMGEIIGEVTSSEAEIEGRIEGNLSISELLYLRASSRINGNITSSKLIIENGATFNGLCTMDKTKVTEVQPKIDEKLVEELNGKSDIVY